MRTGRWVAAVTIAVVVAAFPLVHAVAGNPHNVVVFDPEGDYSEVIDGGAEGFGAGDVILEHHELLDPETGADVGEIVTRVGVVRSLGAEDFVAIVDCTVVLDDGKLQFSGGGRLSDVEEGLELPVTGGTGRYASAVGTVTITHEELGGQPGALLTFDLVPGR